MVGAQWLSRWRGLRNWNGQSLILVGKVVVSDFACWLSFQVKNALFGRQILQPFSGWSHFQQGPMAQQRHGIGQQAQAPGPAQAVEKLGVEAQHILLKGLAGFDPGAGLLEQRLRGPRA